jgi:hypothetical protein
MNKVVKWLQGKDLDPINKLMAEEQRGWTPIRRNSLVLAVFDENGLAAFNALQAIPHPEPLWVRKDLRGSGLGAELAAEMVQFMKDTDTGGFMCVAETPEVEELCKSFGMSKIEKPVYVL